MYDRIKASILRFGNFSADQMDVLISRLSHINVVKGEILFKEGQVCQNFYFINSGAFRQQTILDTGEEATLNLWIAGEWMFE